MKQLSGLVAFFAACTLVVWLLLSRPRRQISSRSCTNKNGEQLPEIAFDVRSMKLQRAHELSHMVEECANTSPCLIRNGPNQELVITQPSHIDDFHGGDHEKEHTKARNSYPGNSYGFLTPGPVSSQSGQGWLNICKHFEPLLSTSATSQRIPRFTREIKTWIKNLDLGDVDSQPTFRFVLFRMLAVHLYEDVYDDRMYWRMLELYQLYEKALQGIAYPPAGPNLLALFSINPAPITRKFRREWQEFNRNIINLARNGKWTCPIEVIYRGVTTHNDMADDAFQSTLSEILFTNVDGSSRIFSTIFTNLAANPAVQNALRSEIRENEVASDSYVHRTDTLLHRVLQESMRLCPPLSFSTPESLADAKTIGGYHMPAQTAVVIDARRINQDPMTWGAGSDKWDPDRFLRVDPKSLRSGLVRYGVGPASLAADTADVIFKITVKSILEELSLDPVGDARRVGKADLVMTRL